MMRINDKLKNLLNRARIPRSLESVKFGDLLADIAEDAAAGVEGTTTDIQRETDGYFVDIGEVASILKEFCLGEAGVQSYYDSPVKIGTWIGGKPVYRKAFDVLLKDMTEQDYADALRNTAFTVGMISASGSAYPISTFCAYVATNGNLYYCGINTLADVAVDFSFAFGMSIPDDQSECDGERYYGYIDFIKTGDDA